MFLDQPAEIVENLISIGLRNQLPEVRQCTRLRWARGGTGRLRPCMILLLESFPRETDTTWPASAMLSRKR